MSRAGPTASAFAKRAGMRMSGADSLSTFALCALGAYITTLDLSVVNVAFPEILRDFGATRADASWILTAYNICFAGLLIVSGKLADQLGRRRFFLIGVAVFGIGSVACP